MPDYLATVTGNDGIQTCYLTLLNPIARFTELGINPLTIDDLTLTLSDSASGKLAVLGTPALNASTVEIDETGDSFTAGQVLVFKLQSSTYDTGDYKVFLKIARSSQYVDSVEFDVRKQLHRS